MFFEHLNLLWFVRVWDVFDVVNDSESIKVLSHSRWCHLTKSEEFFRKGEVLVSFYSGSLMNLDREW
jgi:hypothetical protein